MRETFVFFTFLENFHSTKLGTRGLHFLTAGWNLVFVLCHLALVFSESYLATGFCQGAIHFVLFNSVLLSSLFLYLALGFFQVLTGTEVFGKC